MNSFAEILLWYIPKKFQGPGLEATGNIVHRETYFEVYTSGCGVGDLNVRIIDERGNSNAVLPEIQQTAAGK